MSTSTLRGPMNGLTGFQRDLMYAVASMDEANGLAIEDRLEQYYETIHHSRLYQNFEKLEKLGYVEREYPADDDRQKLARLTEEGKKALKLDARWRKGCAAGL